MALSPRASTVPAPSALPPTQGLIATARVLQGAEAGDRWGGGFAYLPEGCAASGTANPCSPGTLTLTDGPDVVGYDPVVLWAGDTCSALDLPRDWEGRARRLLERCQSKLLAHELWTGAQATAMGADNAFLASLTANVLTAAAVDEVDALACLEEGLAACGCGRGMIHATPGTVTRWKAAGAVERISGSPVLRTAMDTIVVADVGYDGSGPDGAAAASGHVWAYGTDLVAVRLGDVETFPKDVRGAVDRETNDIAYRAERLAAATWDGCCHVAVEIDIDVCVDLAGS